LCEAARPVIEDVAGMQVMQSADLTGDLVGKPLERCLEPPGPDLRLGEGHAEA
jgi:hypothetical protein